jgi:hypothetical protein
MANPGWCVKHFLWLRLHSGGLSGYIFWIKDKPVSLTFGGQSFIIYKKIENLKSQTRREAGAESHGSAVGGQPGCLDFSSRADAHLQLGFFFIWWP